MHDGLSRAGRMLAIRPLLQPSGDCRNCLHCLPGVCFRDVHIEEAVCLNGVKVHCGSIASSLLASKGGLLGSIL